MSKRKTTTAGADAPDVRAIHKRLKEIVTGEIEKLPALLEQLPAAERVKVLTELLPYCAPKLDKAPHNFGEPIRADWGTF